LSVYKKKDGILMLPVELKIPSDPNCEDTDGILNLPLATCSKKPELKSGYPKKMRKKLRGFINP
jgi:hypothetical protein